MTKLLTIHPPLAGIVRSRGQQQMPPYSCRESVNFWPQFATDGSETLAIRPPLSAFVAAVNTVNLLARVNGTTAQTPQRTFVAGVNGTLYRWTGAALAAVGGAGVIPSGRAAFAQAFEQSVYIPAAAPLVYNYPTDTLSAWTATAGTVPVDARIIVYWAGGLWVAGQPDTPHIVSGCATGAPLDWNFNGTGEGAAFSTIGDNAGLISDPVTALIPISGDSMIVSGPDSMQIWRGHPRRGGVADVLSESVGVRGQGAWAQGPDGTIYAVTNKGFVSIQNGNAIGPISEDRIPAELIGFDYDYLDPRINCAFDARFNCIHITVRDGADSESWYYDLKNGGLFEIDLADNDHPFVMMRFDPAGSGRASEVLFGDTSGTKRYNLDGSESISNARIVMGPMKLTSSPTQRAKIKEANIVFGGGATALAAEVGFYCGPTLDSSYAAATSGDTATKHVSTVERVFKAHGRIRPMVAGHGLSIVIDHGKAQTNPKLPFEEATLVLEDAGRERAYVQHSDTSGPRAGSFIPPGAGLLTGLYAYYDLDEASGTRQDSHTNNHDLTEISGTIDDAAGILGQGALMPTSGADDPPALHYDNQVSLDLLNAGNGITLAIWMKNVSWNEAIYGAENSYPVAAIGGGANDSACSLEVQADGSQAWFNVGDGTTSVQAIITGLDLNDGEWHLLVGKYNPSLNLASIGVDNVFESVAADPIDWPVGCDPGVDIRGGVDFGADIVVQNVADECGAWNRCLTVKECGQLWNSGAGRTYPFT